MYTYLAVPVRILGARAYVHENGCRSAAKGRCSAPSRTKANLNWIGFILQCAERALISDCNVLNIGGALTSPCTMGAPVSRHYLIW